MESPKFRIFVILDHFGFSKNLQKSAKLQIFVILHHCGVSKNIQNGQNKGFWAYFADSGKRQIADFVIFDPN